MSTGFVIQLLSRSLSPATGMQLPQGKPITQAHLHMLRQQQLQQQQQQAASPQGIKAVGKPQVCTDKPFIHCMAS